MGTNQLFGHETSGTYANRPLNAEPGFQYWATDLRLMLVYDSLLADYRPVTDGGLIYLPDRGFAYDDFRGQTLSAEYTLANGSDAQAIDPALNSGDFLLMTSGDSGTAANDLSSAGFTTTPFLEAEEGEITLIGAYKIDVITGAYFFFGLSDSDPDAAAEEPAQEYAAADEAYADADLADEGFEELAPEATMAVAEEEVYAPQARPAHAPCTSRERPNERSTSGQQAVNEQSTDGQQTVNSQQTVNIVNRRSTEGPQSGDRRPMSIVVPPVLALAGRYSDRVTVTVTAM